MVFAKGIPHAWEQIYNALYKTLIGIGQHHFCLTLVVQFIIDYFGKQKPLWLDAVRRNVKQIQDLMIYVRFNNKINKNEARSAFRVVFIYCEVVYREVCCTYSAKP